MFPKAYRCQSEIDSTTLLSLLPDSLTRLYLTRRHDDRISTHPEWRWCPNPKCGRLVRVGQGKERGLEPVLGLPVPLRVWPIVVLGVLPAISLASNLQAGSLPLGTHQGDWWVLVLVCIGLLCGCHLQCMCVCVCMFACKLFICNVSSS